MNQMVNVLKAGGSSLATRELIERFLINCVVSNPENKYLIVSAPGKKNIKDKTERKVTCLLKEAATKYPKQSDSAPLRAVRERFSEIYSDFPEIIELATNNIGFAINSQSPRYEDQSARLGEYIQAEGIVRVANKLGIRAVLALPEKIDFFLNVTRDHVMPDPSCYPHIKRKLQEITTVNPNALIVIPGYYAQMQNGILATMERGGSDITGSVIARAVNAQVYQNWTDFRLHVVDPNKVPNNKVIKTITREEVEELAVSGDFKLNSNCFVPLKGTHIPIEVKNTNNPNEQGTLVLDSRIVSEDEKISGITYKEKLVALEIKKHGMNYEKGFGDNIFRIFEEEGFDYIHSPTGVHRMAIVMEEEQIKNGKLEKLIRRWDEEVGPLEVNIRQPLSIVGVAGLGMKVNEGAVEDVLSALREKGIKRSWPGIGSSDISFFVGIEGSAQQALEALYQKFYG